LLRVSTDLATFAAAEWPLKISAADFRDKDIEKLIDIGTRSLPPDRHLRRAVEDRKSLYRKDPGDWGLARKEMAEKHFDGEPTETRTITNANLNGAAGILALLYGRGDFPRTQRGRTCAARGLRQVAAAPLGPVLKKE
jgi:hypothetical protein